MSKKYIITEEQQKYLMNTLKNRKRVNEIFSEITKFNKGLNESHIKSNSILTILEKYKNQGKLNETVIMGLIKKNIPKKYFRKLKLIK